MARKLNIALLASLVFNVFAVGVFAGQLMTGGEHPSAVAPRGGDSPMRMMRYAKELPAESRVRFREVLRADIPNLREKKEELRALKRIYDEAVQADRWDRGAVDAALHDVQTARAEIRGLIDVAFLDAVESLSPEDRALLRETSRKHRHRRNDRHDPRCDNR